MAGVKPAVVVLASGRGALVELLLLPQAPEESYGHLLKQKSIGYPVQGWIRVRTWEVKYTFSYEVLRGRYCDYEVMQEAATEAGPTGLKNHQSNSDMNASISPLLRACGLGAIHFQYTRC